MAKAVTEPQKNLIKEEALSQVSSANLQQKRKLALFPGLLTVLFLIPCSMQKQRGKAWYILSE